jgi:hypothetical protein
MLFGAHPDPIRGETKRFGRDGNALCINLGLDSPEYLRDLIKDPWVKTPSIGASSLLLENC